MVDKIDLQGSTVITMANKVAKICMPLRNLSISGFQYMRKYADGSRFILCDKPELMQYFYEEHFYPLTWYDHNRPFLIGRSIFEFWPVKKLYNTPEQDLLDKNIRQLFRIDQSITYLEVSSSFWEVFRFYSNNKFIYYLNPQLLIRFMFFFKENMHKWIIEAKQNCIVVPLSAETPPQAAQPKDENDFINLTPIKKYYLPGKLSKIYLTSREKDCLFWCAKGKSSYEISIILGINKRTVENMIQNVKCKMNCYKQSELIVSAIKTNVFPL